jgi:predicted amidohydrolase
VLLDTNTLLRTLQPLHPQREIARTAIKAMADPRGRIFAQASRDQDEVLTADLELDRIAEVRKTWRFSRDRHRDMYQSLVKA